MPPERQNAKSAVVQAKPQIAATGRANERRDRRKTAAETVRHARTPQAGAIRPALATEDRGSHGAATRCAHGCAARAGNPHASPKTLRKKLEQASPAKAELPRGGGTGGRERRLSLRDPLRRARPARPRRRCPTARPPRPPRPPRRPRPRRSRPARA
eukprot:5323344-Prymnesium_polylepis.1